jgi:recombination protein RecT
MSTTASALKAVATGQVAKSDEPKDLAHLMANPKVQAQIKAALPRHMTAERMARIATTEMRKVPKLAQCDPMSFLGAVIQCAQLGLEPGNALGHAYILPYEKRTKVGGQWRTERVEAQVIIGYRGMIDLARRSGQIVSIDARAVYEGDKFDCRLGLDAKLEHEPDWQNPNRAQPDKLRFVYAVAKLKDDGIQFDVMSRAEVEGVRARSKAADSGPWVTDYSAMALKTVVRRLFKFLPVSIEMQQAVGIDEMADAGISQQNGAIIDGAFTEVEPAPELEQNDAPASDASSGQGDQEAAASLYHTLFNRLNTASDLDVLDVIADEIRDVFDSGEQAKLSALYQERRAALTGE